jgi:hypothetical protein
MNDAIKNKKKRCCSLEHDRLVHRIGACEKASNTSQERHRCCRKAAKTSGRRARLCMLDGERPGSGSIKKAAGPRSARRFFMIRARRSIRS